MFHCATKLSVNFNISRDFAILQENDDKKHEQSTWTNNPIEVLKPNLIQKSKII